MQHVCALARSKMLTLHPLLPPLLSLRAFRLPQPQFVRRAHASAQSTAAGELTRITEAAERTAAASAQSVRPAHAPKKRRVKETSSVQHNATEPDAAARGAPVPVEAHDLQSGAPQNSAIDWRAVKRWCGLEGLHQLLFSVVPSKDKLA